MEQNQNVNNNKSYSSSFNCFMNDPSNFHYYGLQWQHDRVSCCQLSHSVWWPLL